MSYKIFIKTALTVGLLGNPHALFGDGEWRRPIPEAPRQEDVVVIKKIEPTPAIPTPKISPTPRPKQDLPSASESQSTPKIKVMPKPFVTIADESTREAIKSQTEKPTPLTLEEVDKQFKDQDERNKILAQEIKILESKIKRHKGDPQKLAEMQADLEKKQREAIKGLQDADTLYFKKSELGKMLQKELKFRQEISNPKTTEISKITTIDQLTEEQKDLVASLGDRAIDAVINMTEEEIKSLPTEYKLRLYQIISTRGMMINAAQMSISRQGEIRTNFLQNPTNAGKMFPTSYEDELKKSRDMFKFAEQIPENLKTPKQIAEFRTQTIAKATQKANDALKKLGNIDDLYKNTFKELKIQIENLSKKKNLTEAESQELSDAKQKYLTLYFDHSQKIPEAKREDLKIKFKRNEIKSFLKAKKEALKKVKKQQKALKDKEKQPLFKAQLKKSKKIEQQLAELQDKINTSQQNAEQAAKDQGLHQADGDKLKAAALAPFMETKKQLQTQLNAIISELYPDKDKLENKKLDGEKRSLEKGIENLSDLY